MLALLAQAKKQQQHMMSDIVPAGTGDSDVMMTDDYVDLGAEDCTERALDTRESLLALTDEIDRQLATLKGFLANGFGENPQDCAVINKIMQEYSGELARIESNLAIVRKGCTEGSRQTEALLGRLNRILVPQPSTPQSHASPSNLDCTMSISERRLSRFATPLRVGTTGSTPRSVARSTTGIDFEAFPHTPTLEQLGFSKAALDVIGDRRKANAAGLEKSRGALSGSSDLGSELSLNHSYGINSASMATPLITTLRSMSSFGSQPRLDTRASEFRPSDSTSEPPAVENSLDISSTPTIVNGMTHTSPFGGLSSTGGRGRLMTPSIVDVTSRARLTASSWKQSNEVANIIDNDTNTFWQSEGQLPHYVQFDFSRRTNLSSVKVILNPANDESYTPSEIVIQAGDCKELLVDVALVAIPEGASHVDVDLMEEPVDAFCLRLLIISNFAHGKDSRLREVRLGSLTPSHFEDGQGDEEGQ